MREQSVIIRPHHFAGFAFGHPPRGYDEIHDTEIKRFHEEMLALPPETSVDFTFGPDRICFSCPLNVIGPRFSLVLLSKLWETVRDRGGCCDPEEDIWPYSETTWIRELREKSGSRQVTLSVLPKIKNK